MRVVHADELDTNTPQTPGMNRAAAITHARAGAEKLWAGTVVIHPKAKTGAHHHGAVESVIYVVSGRARMKWGDRLEYTAEAGPGDFIYIPPFVPHQEINASDDEPLSCVLCRSGQEPVVVNLDLPNVEPNPGGSALGRQHSSGAAEQTAIARTGTSSIAFDRRPMDADQQRAVLTLCLMAAFADGANADASAREIKRIAGTLGADSALDAAAIYQDVLLNKPDVRAVAAAITLPEQRQFAYEMAVGVCNADGATTPAEREFLATLAAALGVDQSQRAAVRAKSERAGERAACGAGAGRPIVAAVPADAAALDATILNYAIVNGALELLPQSLASMAIIPLQMKMVYADRQGVRLRARPRATSRNCSPRWASVSRRSSSSSSAASSSAACWAGSAAACWAARAA